MLLCWSILDTQLVAFYSVFVFYRFVGRFMSRRERLEVLGDKMRKFNNVYVKNFSEEIDDEKLRDMFEPYGKIISAKV